MHDTLRCPACKAELTLPALSTGQTVQCPRCRETVDPVQPFRTALKAQPPPAAPARSESAALDDHLPDDLRTLLRPDPLRGEWLTYVAMALLGLSVFSFLVQIGFSWQYAELSALEMERESKLHTNLQAADFRDDLVRLRAELDARHAEWKPIGEFAALCDRLTYWPAVLAFLVWLYQASCNLRTLKTFGASHEPATAVLSFFVPIVNLYWPYVIVQEIWQGSDPQATANKFAWFDVPASNTIRYWWTLFLTGQVIGWMSAIFLWSSHWDRVNAGAWLACLANMTMAFAGMYLIAIVHRITARQRERWHRLYTAS